MTWTPFCKFPKLVQLADHQDQVLALPEVIVTEKIHGTNARFGIIDGAFRIGSRNVELDASGADMQHFGFVGFARQMSFKERMLQLRADQLERGLVIYGEFFGGSIQAGVDYGASKQFRPFKMRFANEWTPYDDFLMLCSQLGLQPAPLLYRGKPDPYTFDSMRYGQSTLGDGIREGIVVEPPAPTLAVFQGSKIFDDEWLICKYKSPAFEEIARAPTSIFREGPTELQKSYAKAFVDHFVTGERLNHVVQRLNEEGVQCVSVRDVGHVLRGMSADVLEECARKLPDGVEWKVAVKYLVPKTKELYVASLKARGAAV